MTINIIEVNGTGLAEIISGQIEISDTQDALNLMANCRYQGSGRIIIHEYNLIAAFFDLKTGIAGDILQKFSNYRAHLAIVGDFSKYPGKSLRDFIFESNKTGRIFFVKSREEAIEKLAKA